MSNSRAQTTPSRPRRNERGLTLLEVLAAVMIFAMVMTVLISTSTNAVYHMSQSKRRIDADQIADTLLSGLEIQIRQGLAPEIEDDEFSQDLYSIRMTMTDLIPSDSIVGPGTRPSAASANLSDDALSLLGGTLPEVASYLRQYDIEVVWLEPKGPQSVLRTTFAYDWPAAQIELASLIESASSANAFGDDDSGPGGADGEGAGNGGSGGSGSRGDADDRDFDTSIPFNARNAGERQRNSDALRNRFQNQ